MRARIGAASILLLANFAIFARHYLGEFGFPWDFHGGYHAMAYALYADGGLFAPELWSPYGNLGFPTHLAVQNSAFYAPLELLGLVGVRYTLAVAIWVQCLHVLAGSLGVAWLLRLQGLGWGAAVTGGLAFQLCSGFFSSAQHVDIVRGYALLPWVLIAVSPRFLVSARRIAFSAWILFMFLAGSYPGIVVSTFYGALAYIACEATGIAGWRRRRTYLALLLGAGGLALLLSAIKFLPLVPMRDELFRTGVVRGIQPEHLLTTLFRFDLRHLPDSLTMRSLHLPATVWILIALTPRMTRLWTTGLVLSAVALVLAVHDTGIRSWMLELPGMRLSKFQLSDFRMLFHLGLIAMAAASLDRLLEQPMPWKRLAVRAGALALALGVAAQLALANGYTFESIRGELVVILCSAAVVLAAAALLRSSSPGPAGAYARWIAIAGIGLATGIGGYSYALHAPQTWQTEAWRWKLSKVYGQNVDALMQKRERRTTWDHRPARILANRGRLPSNQSYYAQEFNLVGYDNAERLTRSKRFRRKFLVDLRGVAKSNPMVAFVSARSTHVLVPNIDPDTVEARIERCVTRHRCGDGGATSVAMQSFGISTSRYRVASDGSPWLVENELFYPGWRSRICRDGECRDGPDAAPTYGGLRAWQLPWGEYDLETWYEPPLWSWARGLFALGVLASLALLVSPWRPGEGSNPRPVA